jgi:hypothetical protein
MSDDSLDEFRHTPTGWALEQEMEIAAEVYSHEPKGIRSPRSAQPVATETTTPTNALVRHSTISL